MKKLILCATIDTVSVTLSRGDDSRTKGTDYWFIYPSRYDSIVPNNIWDDLGVSKEGAGHFWNESEALEYIQDNIANCYNVHVNVYSETGYLITTLYPE